MILIEEGLEIITSLARSKIGPDFMPAEYVPLVSSVGRILREDAHSDTDSPPFDRSIKDGFAVRVSDLSDAGADLKVVGESRAGQSFEGSVGPGECCEIMTGASVPEGADAVVMVEYTERPSRDIVRIRCGARGGENIQPEGTEARRGDLILPTGRGIRTSDLGILATVGKSQVLVSAKPRVAIISTGDELVDVDRQPGRDQIRNSNSYTLYAQILQAGGQPEMLGIARDNVADLREKIGEGLKRNILLASGGVSMGKYDLVEGIFDEFGVEVSFDKVAMKPGKPTVFGHRDKTFVFGLPGNPVSTMVSFELLVRPLIRLLLQASDQEGTVLEAILKEEFRCDPVRFGCLPVSVRFEDGAYRLSRVQWKGSSDLVGLSQANAYVLLPRQEGHLGAGTAVKFIPIAADC